MNKKQQFTEGSIVKSLITLAVPIIMANLLYTAYQLTDTFWVGKLGAEAVAAVSICYPVVFLIISLGGGLAIAGTILVAQFKGKGEHNRVNYIAAQTLMLVVVVSIILAVFGITLSPILVKFMGAEQSVFNSALLYMKISFIGMIFMFIYMVFQSLMRGVGNVKIPVVIVLGTVLLNLIFDPLFIFGFGPIKAYGVAGAAIATIGTQGLAALIGVIILLKGEYQIKIYLKDLKPDISLIIKMIKIGFPASIEQSTKALGMTVMTFLVTGFGTLTIAAYGIGSRILSFVIIPSIGLAMAISTLVGHNIGAGKIDRAEKIIKLGALFGFGVLSIMGFLFFTFAKQLSAVFIPGEIEAIESSALFIKIMAPCFGFMGLPVAINGGFRGAGYTMASMVLSLISMWMLRFPLAYILSHHTSLAQIGLWIAFPVSSVTAGFISIIWFIKGSWKNIKITEEISLCDEVTQETILLEGVD